MEKESKLHTEPAAKAPEQKAPAAEHKHSETQHEKKHEAAQAPEKKHEHAAKEGKEPSCEAKLSELTDKCLRISAEFDNYKKRTAKEKEALALHSEARLMLCLLPIYEEIGMAEKEVIKLPEGEARKGTLLVLAKLRKSFESEGLMPMKLEGEKLDPFRHEVALREDSGAPEGTIVRVIKQGYLYKGELLQHAIVSVSSGKKADDDKHEEKPEV